jgi:hypothetical protein
LQAVPALLEKTAAGIIAVDLAGTRRAGPQSHAAATGRADGEAGEESGPSDDARRGDARVTGHQQRLDPFEEPLADD